MTSETVRTSTFVQQANENYKMNEWKKHNHPIFEEFRRTAKVAESLRSLVEAQRWQADKLSKTLRGSEALKFIESQRQIERLTEAQRQADLCFKSLNNLTDPYRPALRQIEVFSAELARTIAPYQAVMGSIAKWERSLVTRMEVLKTSWVLPDQFERSITGFARLARLSDAVHTENPYSAPVAELVAGELGDDIEALPDDTVSDRDEAAVLAGLNPELIAFPRDTYSEVVFATGFDFRFAPMTAPQAIESANSSAVPNPIHWQVLSEVEQRLRHTIEKRLEELSGPNWIKKRIPETLRCRWKERQEEDRDAGRSVYSLIHYADFMDLANVIGQSNNWAEAFEPIFKNREDFIISLRRLHPVRKSIAHSRPLDRFDILILVTEATRIFRALGIRFLA